VETIQCRCRKLDVVRNANNVSEIKISKSV
jgi:hypothetical protein